MKEVNTVWLDANVKFLLPDGRDSFRRSFWNSGLRADIELGTTRTIGAIYLSGENPQGGFMSSGQWYSVHLHLIVVQSMQAILTAGTRFTIWCGSWQIGEGVIHSKSKARP